MRMSVRITLVETDHSVNETRPSANILAGRFALEMKRVEWEPTDLYQKRYWVRPGTIVSWRGTTDPTGERRRRQVGKVLTVFILAPIVEPTDRARRKTNRKMICKLTCFSTAVLLIGAALLRHDDAQLGKEVETHVAFRISLVSWPVKTTMPYIQGVFRSCAPRKSI